MRVILVTSMALVKHLLSFNNKSNNNNKTLWLFFSKEIGTLHQHYCLINLMSLENSAALAGWKGMSQGVRQTCFAFTYLEIVSVMSD